MGALVVGVLSAEPRDRFPWWEIVIALFFIVVVLPLVIAISLVYAASRHESWKRIWSHAFRICSWILGILVITTAVLLFIATSLPLFFLVGVEFYLFFLLVLCGLVLDYLMPVAVVRLVIDDENILHVHELGHDAPQHLAFGFEGAHAAAATFEQAGWAYQATVIAAFQNVADALRALQMPVQP